MREIRIFPSFVRSRWAAIGAAVAVSCGAGGVGLTLAAAPGTAAVFVPITPCRLLDTRPDSQVGPRATPLGADETYTVAATGSQGNCALPADAEGVVLNVTAVGASELTFLTVWPAGATRPTASVLNPAPGAPPTPNAVTTPLSDADEFSIYNRRGSVHLLADVVGYYTRLDLEHDHDDRYPAQAELAALQTQLVALQAQVAALPDEPVPGPRGFSAWDPIPEGVTVGGTFNFDSSTTGSTGIDGFAIDLPGLPPQAITSFDVNFAPHEVATDDEPACTGTEIEPTAPPGMVCIYVGFTGNVVDAWGVSARGPRAFAVQFTPGTATPGEDMYMSGTWAYTSPGPWVQPD